MSKKEKIIAIGTSPFIYSYLKINKIEATVYDNNNMDFLGGMWSNTRFENKDFVEFAPHLIELFEKKDLKTFEDIFNLKFIYLKNKTYFCFKNKKYNTEKILHRLLIIFKQVITGNNISYKWLGKQKNFLLNNKRYIQPEKGYSQIGKELQNFFVNSNKINLVCNKIKEINIGKDFISVKPLNDIKLKFDRLILTRGISECKIFFQGNDLTNFWDKKNQIIQNTIIRVKGKLIHSARYYKFINEDIDRIAKIRTEVDSSVFVVQRYIKECEKNQNKDDLHKIIKATLRRYDLISSLNEIELIKTHYGYSASFSISDDNFKKINKILPRNVQMINSKAFSPFLLELDSNEDI